MQYPDPKCRHFGILWQFMAFWYFCQKVGQEIRSDFSDFIRFFPFFRLFPTLRLSDSTALVKMPTPYLRKVLATVWCRFGSWNYVVTRPSRILGQGCSSQVGTFWGVLYISLHAFAYGTQLGESTNRGEGGNKQKRSKHFFMISGGSQLTFLMFKRWFFVQTSSTRFGQDFEVGVWSVFYPIGNVINWLSNPSFRIPKVRPGLLACLQA